MGLKWWKRVMTVTGRWKQELLKKVCKTSLMLMQALAELTSGQVDGWCSNQLHGQRDMSEYLERKLVVFMRTDAMSHFD